MRRRKINVRSSRVRKTSLSVVTASTRATLSWSDPASHRTAVRITDDFRPSLLTLDAVSNPMPPRMPKARKAGRTTVANVVSGLSRGSRQAEALLRHAQRLDRSQRSFQELLNPQHRQPYLERLLQFRR